MRGEFVKRHYAGLQCLDMDQQASLHYGEPTGGLAHAVWRCRVYLRAFFD